MKRRTGMLRTVVCVGIILLILSVSVLGCGQRETNSRSETSEEALASMLSGKPIPGIDRQNELADAKAKNADTVAWLYIPGVDVDDPVLQAEDNGHYLRLDENGNYDVWGCYYADCRNHLGGREKLDTNTVIYGHSANNCDAENGLRFTKLHRYMDADFVEKNPYIYLSADEENLIFQIAACFVTDVAFNYIEPNPTGTDLTDFFETVERKNWLDMEDNAFSEGDRILTLSTCCNEYDTDGTGNIRLVVMAKLLPENATAQDFSVGMVCDPEMP